MNKEKLIEFLCSEDKEIRQIATSYIRNNYDIDYYFYTDEKGKNVIKRKEKPNHYSFLTGSELVKLLEEDSHPRQLFDVFIYLL